MTEYTHIIEIDEISKRYLFDAFILSHMQGHLKCYIKLDEEITDSNYFAVKPNLSNPQEQTTFFKDLHQMKQKPIFIDESETEKLGISLDFNTCTCGAVRRRTCGTIYYYPQINPKHIISELNMLLFESMYQLAYLEDESMYSTGAVSFFNAKDLKAIIPCNSISFSKNDIEIPSRLVQHKNKLDITKAIIWIKEKLRKPIKLAHTMDQEGGWSLKPTDREIKSLNQTDSTYFKEIDEVN